MATDPTIFIIFQVGLLIVVSSLGSEIFKKPRLPGVIGAILVGLFIGGPADSPPVFENYQNTRNF